MASADRGDEGPGQSDSAASHALAVLKSLQKLRESSQFCDVQLLVDRQIFPAHRNVLAASSPYFNAMLCGSLAEGNKSSISIYGIPADVFRKLIDYIYTEHTLKMNFRCRICKKTYPKMWEAKRHYYRHLPVTARPLRCQLSPCKWYGCSSKDYAQHKITARHIQRRVEARGCGRDEAIPNPLKVEIDDTQIEIISRQDDLFSISDPIPPMSVQKQIERFVKTATVSRQHQENSSGSLQKESHLVPAKQQEDPLLKTPSPLKKSVLVMPGVMLQSPTSNAAPIPEHPQQAIRVPKSRITTVSSQQEVLVPKTPGTPVRDEPHGSFPEDPCHLEDSPMCPIYSPISSGPAESTGSPAVKIALSALSNSTVMQSEFQRLRADNSLHNVRIRDAIENVVRRLDAQGETLKDFQQQQERSEHQDRMELAAAGATILNILGRKHDHGKGFSAACENCDRGSELLMCLIATTDKRLIMPYQPRYY